MRLPDGRMTTNEPPMRLRLRFLLTCWAALHLLDSESVKADAPHGHFTWARGIVTDAATKLEWQRNATTSTYSWTDASKYCHGLSLDGSGWRLPSINELHTLVDETRQSPSIDPAAFPATTPGSFWTSSRDAVLETNAWSVSFIYGFDATIAKGDALNVRCVR
jgi:hypothetical protein